MRRWRLLAAVTAAGLAARLAHLYAIRAHPFHDFHAVWQDSDMHQLVAWARHLAAGDWLDADTFRPWFAWQEAIAPPEVWNSWFGAHVYYQPPLYPYLLAAALRLGAGLDSIRLLQIALGAVNGGLIGLLGARLFRPAVGWVAGLAAAVYAPFIVYDAELLRGALVMTTQLLLLLALASGHERRLAGEWGGRAADAGVALGLAWLADPAILPFAPLALLWMWRSAGLGRSPFARRVLAAPALFLAGASIALAPLAARNAAVGAPLLSSTTRGPLAFVMGNAPDAVPAGAVIPPSTAAILRRSGYSLTGTISATLALYGGRYAPLLSKQGEKMKALWGSYEVPDNPSFYYAARVSPVAQVGLRFLPVAAFGLVGLILCLPRLLADPRDALLPLFLLSCNALFLLAHVVSRYRQPMVVPLLVLGAHAIVWAVERGWGSTLAVAAASALAMLCLPWAPPEGYGYDRPAEFVQAARLHEERGEVGAALAELDEAIGAARREAPFRAQLAGLLYERGAMLARAGRHPEAAASFEEALEEDPQYGEAAEALERSRSALRPRTGP